MNEQEFKDAMSEDHDIIGAIHRLKKAAELSDENLGKKTQFSKDVDALVALKNECDDLRNFALKVKTSTLISGGSAIADKAALLDILQDEAKHILKREEAYGKKNQDEIQA